MPNNTYYMSYKTPLYCIFLPGNNSLSLHQSRDPIIMVANRSFMACKTNRKNDAYCMRPPYYV